MCLVPVTVCYLRGPAGTWAARQNCVWMQSSTPHAGLLQYERCQPSSIHGTHQPPQRTQTCAAACDNVRACTHVKVECAHTQHLQTAYPLPQCMRLQGCLVNHMATWKQKAVKPKADSVHTGCVPCFGINNRSHSLVVQVAPQPHSTGALYPQPAR